MHPKDVRSTERPAETNRFPKIFGERFRPARRISSLYRVVGGVHHMARDTTAIGTVSSKKPIVDEAVVSHAASPKTTKKPVPKPPAPPARDLLAVAPVPFDFNVKVTATEPVVGITEQSVNKRPTPERVGRLRPTKWLHTAKPTVSETGPISDSKPGTSLGSNAVATKVAATTITTESNHKTVLTHLDQTTPFKSPKKLKEPLSPIRKPALKPSSENVSFHGFHKTSALFDDDEYEDVETESDQEENDKILRSVKVHTKIAAIEKSLGITTPTNRFIETTDADASKKKYKIHYGRRLAQRLKGATVTNISGQTDLESEVHSVSGAQGDPTFSGPLGIQDAESNITVQSTCQNPSNSNANNKDVANTNLLG